jgi:hypothetical protein
MKEQKLKTIGNTVLIHHVYCRDNTQNRWLWQKVHTLSCALCGKANPFVSSYMPLGSGLMGSNKFLRTGFKKIFFLQPFILAFGCLTLYNTSEVGYFLYLIPPCSCTSPEPECGVGKNNNNYYYYFSLKGQFP